MNLGLQHPLRLITITKGSSLSQNRRRITCPLPEIETECRRGEPSCTNTLDRLTEIIHLIEEYNLRLKETILLLENYNNRIKDVIRLVEDKSLSST